MKPNMYWYEALEYFTAVEGVGNQEFRATVENWVDGFVSQEDEYYSRVGYDKFYRAEDYRRVILAMRTLDPHYSEFKRHLQTNSFPDGILVSASIATESQFSDSQAAGSYEANSNLRISSKTTLKTPVIVHIKSSKRDYRPDTVLLRIFLEELAHHVQHLKGLPASEAEQDLVDTFREHLRGSYLPSLFEKLVREHPKPVL